MNKDELIGLLTCQTDQLQKKLDAALSSVSSLTSANEKLTATIDELHKQIASMEEAMRNKGTELSKEKAARQAMRRLQESPSERQSKATADVDAAATGDAGQKPERKRTNNGAKRKTHPECEVVTVVVEPDSPDFNP